MMTRILTSLLLFTFSHISLLAVQTTKADSLYSLQEYQEAGRAGRDGGDATCVLLYSPGDVYTNQFLIEHSEPNPDLTSEQQNVLKARDYDRLKQMTFYSTSNTCLRSFILDYFGEKSSHYCGNCSNCLTQFAEENITVEAQKILSCIKRSGERFGKKIICDVLRGSKNEKVLRFGLNSQTTYGLLQSYKDHQVKDMIDHLEFEGYIEAQGDPYPVLSLTQKAGGVLFEGEQVIMRVAKPKEAEPVRKSLRKRKVIEAVDRDLFAALKALRREIADERGVPAYVVFSDATLVDMCKKSPTSLYEMLEVSGVGRVKLELYGNRFLKVLKEFEDSFRPDEF